ncbi:hypothetical protein BZA70DRAFT_287758 [Myxozyma melibiosi]|uniref:AN1-type domain-containing protein n=1 Tax=Myxozyma melibiosi TaxID=54550 RepID=A0ABR1FF57_9ASCO
MAAAKDGLLNVGEHCAYISCHKLDFLPFKCPDCDNKYCLDHRQPSSHECPAALTKQANSQPSSASPKGRQLGAPPTSREHPTSCYLSTCTTQINTTLSPATRCPVCKNLTCLKHRLSHSCPGAPSQPSTDKKASAMAKFSEWKNRQTSSNAQASSTSASSSSSKISSSLTSFLKPKPSASAAATIARAKAIASLKANAKGDAAVQPANRIYLFVESNFSRSTSTASSSSSVSSSSASPKTAKAEMWFGKDYAIGKVLDKAAARLQVPNQNSSKVEDKDRLRVFHVESGRVLEFSQKIGQAGVKDGDTISLVKGIVMPSLLHD